jgi:hypothetical protein
MTQAAREQQGIPEQGRTSHGKGKRHEAPKGPPTYFS